MPIKPTQQGQSRQAVLDAAKSIAYVSEAQLVAAGFNSVQEETPRRLVASVSGAEKSGKSHFALTASAPIVYFNVDRGLEGVVGKFQSAGKKVLVYDIVVPKLEKRSVDDNKYLYSSVWEDFQDKLEMAYGLGVGTVVVDTGTEMFEIVRLARFGKLTQVMPQNYTETNNEWRRVIDLAFKAKNMNTIYIHKRKAKYVNNVRTNEDELAGYNGMDYAVQINIQTFRREVKDEDGNISPEFSLKVKDCRQNPDVNGKVLDGGMCNFEILLSMVHAR